MENSKTNTNKNINWGWLVVTVCIAALCGGFALRMGLNLGEGWATIVHATTQASVEQRDSIRSVHVSSQPAPVYVQELDVAELLPSIKDSVVSIMVTSATSRPFGRVVPGSGSGFIFYENEDDIFIATNNHVVENTSSIYISIDDRESVRARLIGGAHEADLAVIAVRRIDMETSGIEYTVATIGDSSLMRQADCVVAIGNAMGEGQTVTKGVVSALGLTISVIDQNTSNTLVLYVMKTDAAVNRGNSGGPLFNRDGEVIGIITAKLMGAEAMGYAIPINEAMEILNVLKYGTNASRAVMGIGHENLSEFRRGLFNLQYTGTLVVQVVPGMPAYNAGILPGDVITHVNGTRTYSMDDFVVKFNTFSVGDTITVTILRTGEMLEFEVTLIAAD